MAIRETLSGRFSNLNGSVFELVSLAEMPNSRNYAAGMGAKLTWECSKCQLCTHAPPRLPIFFLLTFSEKGSASTT